MGWSDSWIGRWLREKVIQPAIDILQTGIDPKTLSFSAALGITLGIFPIYGVTALICLLAIAILRSRCNPPTMLLMNLVATPVELSLVIPFLRLGEFILQAEKLSLSKDSLWQVITGKASGDVVLAIFHAMLGWLVAAPFIVGALYIIWLPMLRFAVVKYGALQSEDKEDLLLKDSPSETEQSGNI